ncbi:MAG: radical SAM protein, partial [Myxococcales bacterium]
MKALIKVGYACNEHCSFCHTLEVRHLDDTDASIHRKIERARRLGHSMVVFSGGEPTIRPEILDWATHVASLGLDLGFVTNGRRFAYPEFVDAMLARRLRYAYVSFHGASARVHNRLVRAPAFDETLAAIRHLHGRVEVLTVNCVVTRSNLAGLRDLVDLLAPLPRLTLKFSMTAPKGGGDRLFDLLTPPVTDVARAVADAIRYGLARRGDGPGPGLGHDGLPLCLLPGLEHLYDDLRTNDFRTMTEVGEDDFFPVDDVIKVQPDEPCARCSLRGPCPGLFRGYLDHHPDAARDLQARPGGRANSCNFTP